MSSSSGKQTSKTQEAPISAEQHVGLQLYTKRESRYDKKAEYAKDTEGFVANIDGSLVTLLQFLQANIKDFPDSTRFQVAIVWYCDPNPHWLLTDFYIKDGKLHTLTMDAAVTEEIFVDYQLPLIYLKHFPYGEHYYYYSKEKIQKDQVYCQTFTLDFADKIPKIPPKSLYPSLAEHSHEVEHTSKSKEKFYTYRFGLSDLANMPILAPLFIHLQHPKAIDEMAKSTEFEKFINQRVSSKPERKTFYLYTKKTMDRELKLFEFRGNTTSIENQADSFGKRSRELRADKAKYAEGFYRDQSGLGFVSTPIMAHLRLAFAEKEKKDLELFTTEFLSFLKSHQLPIVSEGCGLFKKRPHDVKQNAIIKMLEEVQSKIKEDRYDSGKVARMLNDIVLNYAGYLVSHGLIDAHQDLNEFLRSQFRLSLKKSKEEQSSATLLSDSLQSKAKVGPQS